MTIGDWVVVKTVEDIAEAKPPSLEGMKVSSFSGTIASNEMGLWNTYAPVPLE
jgi:hypothetical protein